MIYSSLNFIIFFPFLFLLYYLIPARYHKGRNFFLLAVSYLLYINFIPIYSLILLSVTIISFLTGLAIDRHPGNRKLVLNLGVTISLMPLLLFKYYNFFNQIIYDLYSLIGFRVNLHGLNWVIPIGISFFTLQSLGYMMDVYYKRIRPEKNIIDYALFVSFFPSIISGPINKASFFIPQIKEIRRYFDYDKAVAGLKMILWGLFMKVVVADRVGVYVNTIYDNYAIYSSLTCLVASFMYSIQIYCDFAGYSLMAIGVGKTLGFNLTENFNRPYISSSVNEFWKRWHMSLSTWLKDYVYIPLGGNRFGALNTYRNLLITFLISGIWHGANWTFVIWGIVHAVWMIFERMLALIFSPTHNNRQYKGIKILITFLFVNFAWILFRMPSLSDAINYLSIIFSFNDLSLLEAPSPIVLIGLLMVLVKDYRDEFFQARWSLMNHSNIIIRWVTYISLITIILTQGVLDSGQFIYAGF